MGKNIIILALITTIIFLLFRHCGGSGGGTIIKIDTTWITVKGDTAYVPQPYAVYVDRIKYKPVVTEKYDTLYLPELVEMTFEDTIAILSDYYAFYYYSDTIRNKYGKITVNDTIWQNKLSGRSVHTDLSIPEVTKTITLTQPKRNEVYIGASLLGNVDDPIKGYDIDLTFKNKRDRQLVLGFEQIFGVDNFWKVGYKHKISLRKNN